MAPSRRTVLEESFEVEQILQARLFKARKSKRKEWRYLVKWVGYGASYNSWEPERNFKEGIMVNQFWKNTDLNGRDRTDLKQFETIGEIFEPMTSKTKKRQIAAEDSPPTAPSKAPRAL